MERELRAWLIAGMPAMPRERINWGEHPQDGGRPYLVLHLIDLTGGHTMQGPDGLDQARVQIDCYAPIYLDAAELGRSVRSLLDGRAGGGFRLITHSATRITREADEDGIGGLWRASLDFITHWRGKENG